MLHPRLRHWPLWLACGLLIALAFWARPRRIEGLSTLDGQQRWLADETAPIRPFAWQPGEELGDLLPAGKSPNEISRPCLADEGRTLFVTVRRGGGDADIYRSEWRDGRWQPAAAVTELNTPWDDEAVAVSGDGRQLYLASNRRGGEGGFDLYLAPRRPAGWGVPKNLGPGINSAQDERDPAIAPDGLRLYFASNRTGGPTSDLYVAGRQTPAEPWADAVPLARANSAANERSPYLDSSASTLYFASDRPTKGRDANFDLYRVRLGDTAATVESLGRGINTAANETDPAVSADGFGLTFARSGDGAASALYRSRLAEVETFTYWDISRLSALRAVWGKGLLAAVLFGGLVAAVYYYGGWLRRRAAMARFVAASALAHAVILWLLVLVPLSQEIVRRVEEIRVTDANRELFDDNLHQSHVPGDRPYEKLADLKSVERVEAPAVPRQVLTPTNVPLHADYPAPTLPLELARRLPTDRVIFVPTPAEPGKKKIDPDMERSAESAMRVAQIEPLSAAPPKEVASPREQPLAEEVSVQRMPAASIAPHDGPNRERSLAELEMQPSLLQPVDGPQPTSTEPKPDLPPQMAREVPRPADIDPDATALTAVERPDEQSAIEAGLPAVTIAPRDGQTPLLPADDRAPPAMTTPAATASALRPKDVDIPSQAAKIDLPRMPNELPQLAAAETEEAPTPLKMDAPATADVAPAKIDLAPLSPTPPRLATDALEAGGPRQAGKVDLVVGTLAKKAIDSPPAQNPLATKIERETARATPVAFAEDNVGMQAMFALRQGDTRREFIDLVGGNEQTEAAVKRGLAWLAEHQHADGHWSLQQLDPPEKKLPATSGAGGAASDAAATGLGLLPFLASGHTQLAGDYRATVGKGTEWLIQHQKPDGNLFTDSPSTAFMYSHGIATIALCEVYGMSQDERLREPAQRALNFIVTAQHQGTGGWRYQPGEPGDTSVVGWQVMALKSGEMAGLAVPKPALDLANKWLDSVAGKGDTLGTFGYQGPGPTPAMSAEGLLCRQFLGARRDDPALLAGANYLLHHLPEDGQESSYYWYYGTQVMYHLQGDYWTAWNDRLRDRLVASQIKDGHQSGTWDPRDGWEHAGGRLYATSLRLLMLEVYYRHLPLYQPLN
ncbi:MAG TPA: hypothetical protein VHC22_29320 [Pirellulales bacterium]|nr:hypothetical protein [Pirellulales bacterium]